MSIVRQDSGRGFSLPAASYLSKIVKNLISAKLVLN